jgi:hypothetical protein
MESATKEDRLAKMLAIQKAFYDRVRKDSLKPAPVTLHAKAELTEHYVLKAIGELMEVIDECPIKEHDTFADVHQLKLKTELIDVMKYILNIAILWGMTADEIFDLFEVKSDIVEAKYKLARKGLLKKVVCATRKKSKRSLRS